MTRSQTAAYRRALLKSCPSGYVKSFGRRQAYESPRRRNPWATVYGYGDFVFRLVPGMARPLRGRAGMDADSPLRCASARCCPRHALPVPNDVQRQRDGRPMPPTSTASALPRERVRSAAPCRRTARRPISVVAAIWNRRRKQTLHSFQNLAAAVQLSWPVSIFADYAVRRTTFVDSDPRRYVPKVSGPPSNLSAPVLVFAAGFRVLHFEYLQAGA